MLYFLSWLPSLEIYSFITKLTTLFTVASLLCIFKHLNILDVHITNTESGDVDNIEFLICSSSVLVRTSALSGVKEQRMRESQPPPASYWCLVCLYSTLGPSPFTSACSVTPRQSVWITLTAQTFHMHLWLHTRHSISNRRRIECQWSRSNHGVQVSCNLKMRNFHNYDKEFIIEWWKHVFGWWKN